MTPVLTLTAAQLRATAADDEPPVEPAPRRGRGRPRTRPAGEKPKQGPRKRQAKPIRVYVRPADLEAIEAAAERAAVSVSAFMVRAALAAAVEPPAE